MFAPQRDLLQPAPPCTLFLFLSAEQPHQSLWWDVTDVEKSLTISVEADVSANVPTANPWPINKTLTHNLFHKHLYDKLGTLPNYNELIITPS